MKQVFVNSIHKGVNTYGISVLPHTIEEDLQIVFEPIMVKAIKEMARREALNGGMNMFSTFCQYVVLIEIRVVPELHGAIKFIDCDNNIDSALDEYIIYEKNGWAKMQKEEFMKAFQKIQNNPPTELAEMVIKDRFPF